jgi:hypothetical protein
MKNTQIEIKRNNVTVNEFLAYVAKKLDEKGMDIGFSPEDFKNPDTERHSSYSVIDGVKKCHFEEYRTVSDLKRKHASYTTPKGFTRYYWLDEYEEEERIELYRFSQDQDGNGAPCKAETCRTFAHDLQTYALHWDGTCYNEICEFHFNDDKRGYGYYYQANVFGEDKEA